MAPLWGYATQTPAWEPRRGGIWQPRATPWESATNEPGHEKAADPRQP
jgi:hypothetical protein